MASNTRKQPTETWSVFKDVYLKQIMKTAGYQNITEQNF